MFIVLICKTTSFDQAVACVSVAVGLSTFNNRLENKLSYPKLDLTATALIIYRVVYCSCVYVCVFLC